MNAINYSAFTTVSKVIANRLQNEVTVKNNEHSNKVLALWDTGATITCISDDLVSKLNLISTGKMTIKTPSGSKIVNTYLISIILPNTVEIKDVMVCDSDIGDQGIDILIGMNIINLGDLAVTNHFGQTIFTFRIPSYGAIDFVKQAQLHNIRNAKQHKSKPKRK